MKTKIIEKLNNSKIVIGLIVAIIGLVFIWDKTYVRAETEIKNNAQLQESINLQQQTIQEVNTLLSLDIAKLKYESRLEQYNNFILNHGDNMSVMSSINKIKFLAAKTKLDEAEKNYDLLLE